jgi:hypothetical protein
MHKAGYLAAAGLYALQNNVVGWEVIFIAKEIAALLQGCLVPLKSWTQELIFFNFEVKKPLQTVLAEELRKRK